MTMTTATPRITTAPSRFARKKFRMPVASPTGICPECEGTVPLNEHKKITPHGVFRQERRFEYETKTPCPGRSKKPAEPLAGR